MQVTHPANSLRHFVAPALFLALLTGCAKTVELTTINEIESRPRLRVGRAGAMVSLPKTMLSVRVPVTRKQVETGKYRDLAEAFVGLPPFEASGPTYSLGKAEVTPFGKPDENHTYWVDLPGGPFTNNEVSLSLNERGILTEGSSLQDNKTADFVVATIEVGGKLAGTVAKGVSAFSEEEAERRADLVLAFLKYKKIKNPQAIFNLLQLSEEDREKALKDGEASSAWKSWIGVRKEFVTLARDAARINALRPKLENAMFTAGLGGVEVRSAIIASIKAELDPLLAKFVGKEIETTWPARWVLEPRDQSTAVEPADLFVLLHLKKDGPNAGVYLGASDDRRELQVDMPKEFAGGNKSADPLTVSMNGDAPLGGKIFSELDKRRGSRSFRYRIPVRTTVTVGHGVVTLEKSELDIGQFGRIAYLPRSTGSASTKWEVVLDPVTGGPKKIAMVNKAFDPALVGKAGAGANELLGGIAARNSVDSELASLQREAAVLKAKSDIAASRAALAGGQ